MFDISSQSNLKLRRNKILKIYANYDQITKPPSRFRFPLFQLDELLMSFKNLFPATSQDQLKARKLYLHKKRYKLSIYLYLKISFRLASRSTYYINSVKTNYGKFNIRFAPVIVSPSKCSKMKLSLTFYRNTANINECSSGT